MNNSELIQNLSSDLKPVKVFKIGQIHLLLSLGAGFFSILTGLALVGLRADLLNLLQSPAFYIETFLLVALAFFSTVTALQMTAPGFSKKQTLPLVLVTLMAWVLFAVYKFMTEPVLPFDNGIRCLSQIALGSLVPAAFIFFIAFKGIVLHRAKLGAAVLIAGSAYGALMAEFSCAVCNPLHFVVWHVAPVITLSLLGLWAGRLFLRKI